MPNKRTIAGNRNSSKNSSKTIKLLVPNNMPNYHFCNRWPLGARSPMINEWCQITKVGAPVRNQHLPIITCNFVSVEVNFYTRANCVKDFRS